MNSKKDLKTKIVIAEDHKLMRNAYVDLLKEREDFAVVGEAANGKELLDVLQKVKTDIILLDLEMPVMKGGEAHEKIKVLYPDIKTIIISTYFDDGFVTEYFMRGVNGYLSKSCEPEEIYDAIDAVMNENYYFTKELSRILLTKMMKDKEQRLNLEKIKLTETEIRILKLLCEEKSSKMIAETLGLTVYVVDHNRRSIQAKTQQSSAIGLFKFAIKNGIASIE